MQPDTKNKLEGTYTLDGDYLKSSDTILKVGMRHRPKKGQAKRFIGFFNANLPENDQFTYISSLYSVQGLKNSYELEYAGSYYSLAITGLNSVQIAKKEKEPVLSFTKEMGATA